MNYYFSQEETEFNSSLDSWDLLLKMGFVENSLYRDGNTVRLFCPLHKDQIRRSMIIYTDTNTYKCQYTACEGHKGGNLLEFYAAYMGCEIAESMGRILNQGSRDSDLVERADKMIQEGQLVGGLPLLQKAVSLDPSNPITRCRLGALYLELGDKDAGYKEYMAAAEHYGVVGELDKTLQIYNIMVIISPDDVKVRKQLSYLYSRLRREDEAVAQLKWVVDRHVRKGEFPEAAAMCRKMIELCPEYPDSHRILGEILLKQGNVFDAIEELRTAATHYIRENQLKKAKESIDIGLRFAPGNPSIKELKDKIERAIELQQAAAESSKDEREQEFDAWLSELKASIGLDPGGAALPPGAVQQARPPVPKPVRSAPEAQAPDLSAMDTIRVQAAPGLDSSSTTGPSTVRLPAVKPGELPPARGAAPRGTPPSSPAPAESSEVPRAKPPGGAEPGTESTSRQPAVQPGAPKPGSSGKLSLPTRERPPAVPASGAASTGGRMSLNPELVERTSESAPAPVPAPSRAARVGVDSVADTEEKPDLRRPQTTGGTDIPHLAKGDPRIELCRQTLQDRSLEELLSLKKHLVNMFDDIRTGHREGSLTAFEANAIREFYAAFSIALDMKSQESMDDSM